jgi:hypothetical protein
VGAVGRGPVEVGFVEFVEVEFVEFEFVELPVRLPLEAGEFADRVNVTGMALETTTVWLF